MYKSCDICKRSPLKGHKVSHSNIKTIRRQNLNLHNKTINGKKVKVCAKCLRTIKKRIKTNV